VINTWPQCLDHRHCWENSQFPPCIKPRAGTAGRIERVKFDPILRWKVLETCSTFDAMFLLKMFSLNFSTRNYQTHEECRSLNRTTDLLSSVKVNTTKITKRRGDIFGWKRLKRWIFKNSCLNYKLFFTFLLSEFLVTLACLYRIGQLSGVRAHILQLSDNFLRIKFCLNLVLFWLRTMYS
jgi:hypothetical protein